MAPIDLTAQLAQRAIRDIDDQARLVMLDVEAESDLTLLTARFTAIREFADRALSRLSQANGDPTIE